VIELVSAVREKTINIKKLLIQKILLIFLF